MIPRYLNELITEKTALDLVNNGLQDIAYEKFDLELEIRAKDYEIQHLKQRYVDHSINAGKDNIIIIIRKHTKESDDKYHNLPYHIALILRCKRYVRLCWVKRHFHDHEIIVEIGNLNSLDMFNRFEEE